MSGKFELDRLDEYVQKIQQLVRFRVQVNKIPYSEIKLATNNFEITRKLGWGAFGKVYRGNLEETEIAVKVLNKFGAEHFEREMLVLLQGVDHVNLLPPMAVSDDGGILCLVYKFMSNGSLEARLACKVSTLPVESKSKVFFKLRIVICR